PGWRKPPDDPTTLIVKPRCHPVDNAKVIHRRQKTARGEHPARRMLTEWYKHSTRVTTPRALCRIPVSPGSSAARTAGTARTAGPAPTAGPARHGGPARTAGAAWTAG